MLSPPRTQRGGAPRRVDMRAVLDTLLYQNRTGCQWDMLPHDLLPKSTVYEYFAAEVLTILMWAAWRGLKDKAKVHFYVQMYHRQDFPVLGAYGKFVEASNRYSVELGALLALGPHRNHQAQHAYPFVLQDSTALAICHVARAG